MVSSWFVISRYVYAIELAVPELLVVLLELARGRLYHETVRRCGPPTAHNMHDRTRVSEKTQLSESKILSTSADGLFGQWRRAFSLGIRTVMGAS
jgi:hypothetical protein